MDLRRELGKARRERAKLEQRMEEAIRAGAEEIVAVYPLLGGAQDGARPGLDGRYRYSKGDHRWQVAI